MRDAVFAPYFYPRSPCGERRYVRRMARQAMYISIHALLAESDLIDLVDSPVAKEFLSTLSLRRATYGRINDISRLIFLSTLSLRRATHNFRWPLSSNGYFYPRSPCGERPRHKQQMRMLQAFLSTLSLRRATRNGFAILWNTCISIHALLAESDLRETVPRGRHVIFLSTLSLRRATPASVTPAASRRNFYPRSPCGERHHLLII